MHSDESSPDLFKISKPIDPMSWAFLINRLQTLYYVLFFPNALTEPSLIWFILLAAVCSHLNIWLLANWLHRKELPAGYGGTFRLFGGAAMWLFSLAGLLIVLVKCAVLLLGYVEIVHQILFPSLNPKVFAVLLLVACFYLARLGMEKTLRFGIIVFIGTIWVVAFYIPFLFPPKADYYHLLPVMPEWNTPHAWNAFIIMWTAFAGPEYLLVLSKRAVSDQRFKTSLLIGNALTTIEYLFFCVIALLFYGSEYLRRLDLPVVQLIRYIQLPFAERLEMIVIPAYALSVIYVVAILMLYATGVIRILTGASHRPSGRKGVWPAFVLLLITTLAVQHWVWANEAAKDRSIEWHSMLDASTYFALPILLLIATFFIKKRGTLHAANHPAD